MSDPEATTRKSKKRRSPAYPAIDLGTAVTRAEQLHNAEGRNWAPVVSILDAWGYQPKSSGGLLALAALKRFGLLEDRGSMKTREARLTSAAIAIILDEREDSSERQERLKHAALMPPIHQEIWEKYDGVPSDSTLRYHLTVEREFTTTGADDFIAQWRRTLEFARLASGSAMVSPDGEDNDQNDHQLQEPPLLMPPAVLPPGPPAAEKPPGEQERTTRTVQVTYSPDEWALLQARFPMSEEDWDSMIDVLNAMKRGLIRPRSTDS